MEMKRVPKLSANLVIVPHDGATNPGNLYGHLTPAERQKKIAQFCARIYLRMHPKQPAEPPVKETK
ncbi:MAG: hypothetical protein HYY16_04845 [Planctomycetes bacterium]|nr:hypothetical protein [Planctomycetota bacterium]